MKFFRLRLLSILGIAAVLLAPFSANIVQADTAPFEQFKPTVWSDSIREGGYTGIFFNDTQRVFRAASGMIAVWYENGNQNGKALKSAQCASVSDKACEGATTYFYNAFIAECETSTQTDCVEGITAIKEDGTRIPGKFVQQYPLHPTAAFTGDSLKGIPSGGSNSMWTFDGVTHQGGNKFLVSAVFSIYNGSVNLNSPNAFTVGLTPISITQNSAARPFTFKTGEPDASGYPWFGQWEMPGTCTIPGDTGDCGTQWPFPQGIRYQIKVRTARPIGGFLHGRLDQPAITIDSAPKATTTTIEAGPVRVPIIGTMKKNSDLTPELNAYLDKLGDLGGDIGFIDRSKPRSRESIVVSRNFDEATMKELGEYLLWLPVVKDQAVGTTSEWIARTLSDQQIAAANQTSCLSSKTSLTGMVSTNAGMYIASPPSFNPETQSLEYKVAAPHVDENGKENLGTYSLVLRADVARCIYGFSNAPISAKIEVVSASGASQIATTVVNEKNGWLTLSAAGYGYSNPTIKVKLSQATEEVVAPTKPAKKTITCTKGKTLKKVTGTNPTCPKGYKQK